MPKLPPQRVPLLARLEGTLRDAPGPTRLAHLARAEDLCLEAQPDIDYPGEWLLARLGAAGDPGSDVIPGQALRAALAVHVERVSALVAMRVQDCPGAITTAQLLARWHISPATLARLRRDGLPMRRVRDDRGRTLLAARGEVAEAFAGARAGRLARAAGASRITPADRARLVKRALRYRRCLGLSLNATAARLAARTGRAHETIRRLLRAHEKAAGAGGAFGHAPALRERDGRAILRAWEGGADLTEFSKKARRSRASVRRAMNLARATALRSAVKGWPVPEREPPHPPTSGPAASGLGGPGTGDPQALLALARLRTPADPVAERARLGAYALLRARAAWGVAGLDHLHPHAGRLDEIETWLRWAARLKAELLRPQWRVIVDTAEARLGLPLEGLAPPALARVLREGLDAAGDAIDAMDPSRGGRVAGTVALQVDKVMIRLAPSVQAPDKRATPRQDARAGVPDWTRHGCAWQAIVEPRESLRDAVALGRPDAERAAWLAARFGWSGGPPMTLDALSRAFGLARPRAPIEVQRAVRDALAAG